MYHLYLYLHFLQETMPGAYLRGERDQGSYVLDEKDFLTETGLQLKTDYLTVANSNISHVPWNGS